MTYRSVSVFRKDLHWKTCGPHMETLAEERVVEVFYG